MLPKETPEIIRKNEGKILCAWVTDGVFFIKYIQASGARLAVKGDKLSVGITYGNTLYPKKDLRKANKWRRRALAGETDFRDCDNCPIRYYCFTTKDEDVAR